jgi:tripartite-type tricarboxylate transporter receptor subunit TctC
LRWKPSDFLPLIKGVEAPIAIVVNPNVPAKTLDELVGWVKANPGTLSFTSYSPGTPGHFLGAQMNEKFGLDMGHVPYRGSAQQVNDLIAGHAKIGFVQIASVLPFIAAGQLRAIATTGATRYGALPNTPTFTELGHPDFLATVWYGLVIRSTTPPEIVAKLLDAAKRAHADPQVRAALAPLGLEVSAVSGEELQAAIQRGTDHWARLVKLTGFKAAPD